MTPSFKTSNKVCHAPARPTQSNLEINAHGEAAKVPAKRRGRPVKSTIDKLIPVLYERGALPGELSRLVDLLTSKSHLDQASLGAVIGNLYPSGKIPSTVVLRLVGSLGLGQLKPALTIQALLLKWLVMVYPILEDPAVLSRAYSVLFNKLDTAAYR